MYRKALGFSLIELLLVIALSSVLLLGIGSIYLSSKKLFYTQNTLNTFQENLRMANAITSRTFAVVGYSGCRKLNELNFHNHTSWDFSFTNSIRGYISSHAPAYLKNLLVDGTDAVVIQAAANDITRVIAPVVAGSATVKVMQNPAVKENPLLLISDCSNAELFEAKNWVGSTITANSNFINAYAEGVSEVGRFTEIAYFIGNTGRFDDKNEPINALFMMINRGNKQELLSGIAAMHIAYGIKGRDNEIKYYETKEIVDPALWLRVLSVRLNLIYALENKATKSLEIYVKLQER